MDRIPIWDDVAVYICLPVGCILVLRIPYVHTNYSKMTLETIRSALGRRDIPLPLGAITQSHKFCNIRSCLIFFSTILNNLNNLRFCNFNQSNSSFDYRQSFWFYCESVLCFYESYRVALGDLCDSSGVPNSEFLFSHCPYNESKSINFQVRWVYKL